MLKPSLCSPCPLYRQGYSFSKPDGEGKLGVAIIGESLGDNEATDGMPFRPYAMAGSKLEEAFRLAGYERKQFLLWNVIACQPPGNFLSGAWYENEAVAQCSNHFKRVMDGFKPGHFKRTILGLGNVPLRHLAGEGGSEKRNVGYLRGYVLSSKYGPFISSWHPAFIRRGFSHYTPYLVHDLKLAVEVAGGLFTDYMGHPSFKVPKYNEHPSLDDAWSYYRKLEGMPNRIISYDIETSMLAALNEDERDDYEGGTEIEQIQFSHKRRFGIAFPWQGQFKEIAKKILALPNRKANHNTWNFDNPILRANDARVMGRVDDTQWMFKHYHPALDRNLQSAASIVRFPFPWKHYYGEKLAWYGCADVDAVQWLMHYLPDMMKERGVWGGYDRHVYEIHVELEKASQDRGVPVNPEAHSKLDGQLKERLKIVDAECQNLVPLPLRNVTPRRKHKNGDITFGYMREPTAVLKKLGYVGGIKEVVDEWKRKRKKALDRGVDESKILKANKYVYKKTGLVLRTFADPDGENRQRWALVKPFKPNSSKQVIKYIKWMKERLLKESEELLAKGDKKKAKQVKALAYEYEVPMSIPKKGQESKETTGKDALAELVEATGDDLLGRIREFRSLKKMITNDLPNWLPQPTRLNHVCPYCKGTGWIGLNESCICGNGCEGYIDFHAVKTTWGFVPPTGQLNTRRPNIQNASKHTEVGDLFRRIIEAPSGYVILEADFRSFHVAVMGWRANDADYIRFSQLDPHSIFCSDLDGIPTELAGIKFEWTDSDILAACKEIKKYFGELRQRVAKPAVLGNQLGLGPFKLWQQNKKYITSQGMAAELQARLARRFHKVEKVKKEIIETADRQRFLRNPFERIQYFYDVFSYIYNKKFGKWERKHGQDTEKCLAFEVQSNAFGKVMEDILTMRDLGYLERYSFFNTIHDSVIFMPRIQDVDRCIADIVPVLTRPCEQLWVPSLGKGLSVGVEISVGRNMGKWNETKNPEGMREVKIH